MGTRQYFVTGRLIDGTGAGMRRGAVIVAEDGLVTAVTDTRALPAGVDVVDLGRLTIVPALIDACADLGASPSVDACALSTAGGNGRDPRLTRRHIGYCRGHGVLGVVDTGGCVGEETRDSEHGLAAIRRAVTIPPPAHDGSGDIDDGAIVRLRLSPDVGDGMRAAPLPSLARLRRFVEAGNGRLVTAVANGRDAVALALAAGCQVIEQGYGMGAESLRLMAANGVAWMPELTRAKNGLDASAGGGSVCCRFTTRYVAPGEADADAERRWRALLESQATLLRHAAELGVPLVVGTGAGSRGILHGEAVSEEIKLFTKAGLGIEEAIRAASATPAAIFGMASLGPLVPGRAATFLAVKGTVKQLPRKIAYLDAVFIKGRRVL